MSYRHDPLTIDLICLMAVDPFSEGDAPEPENKECRETEKDSYDSDHACPPVALGCCLVVRMGPIETVWTKSGLEYIKYLWSRQGL